MKKSPALGASLIVISSLCYGTYGVWSVLIGTAFAPFVQATLRSLLVAVLLLAVMGWRKSWQPLQWRRDVRWLGLLLVCAGLISGPYFYAVLTIGIGLTSTLMYGSVLLSMFVFGWLFSGERYTGEKLVATTMGLAGLYAVFGPNFSQLNVLGMVLAIGAGVGVGLQIVVTQKLPYQPLQTTALCWLAGLIGSAALAAVLREPVHLQVSQAWVYLAVYALISVLASWCVFRGARLVDAGTTAILGLLEIVFGVLFGLIFFHERPGLTAYAGMAAISLAALLPYRHHLLRLRMRTRVE